MAGRSKRRRARSVSNSKSAQANRPKRIKSSKSLANTSATSTQIEKQLSGEKQIKNFTDQSLRNLLNSLSQDRDREQLDIYAKQIENKARAIATSNFDLNEIGRLGFWNQRFQGKEVSAEQVSGERLGSRFRTLGFGSTGGNAENKEKIDKVITSCDHDDGERKGRMLSHFYYRAFLRHIYNNNGFGIANNDANKKRFKDSCALIWKQSDTGVVRTKRTDQNTHGPCATSLLAPYIGNAIQAVTNGELEMPVWTNEFPLYGSGPPDTSKGQDEGSKQPRCDGLLVMPDPKKDNDLRALVMMEAKIDSFQEDDKYQSKSNAIDAVSRQPDGDHSWPLLVFRSTINAIGTAVDVLALVPISEVSAVLVPMWESTDSDSLYNAVMASILAAKDFREELLRKDNQISFCQTIKNVAIDKDNKEVFKSFFGTERRDANIDLIKAHIDKNAEQFSLGTKGSYVRMKYVGESLPDEVDVSIFVKVANNLASAHSTDDTCHGDLRIDNMILETGTLVDWDLAGKEGEKSYPKGMNNLVDGQRHPDVQKAIKTKQIGKLSLSKAHDWHSLKEAMKFFEPTDRGKTKAWKKLIEKIDQEDTRAAARASFSLKLNKKALKSKKERYLLGTNATGSPCSPR